MDNTSFEAKKQYDNKDYNSALPLYKNLYDKNPNDKWLAWFYSRCLKECGELDAAMEIAASSYENNPEFDVNNKLLAYLLNDKYFKNSSLINNKDDALILIEKAEFLATLVGHEEKSPLEFCIFQTVKIAKKTFLTRQDERLLDLLNKLDINFLSQANYQKEIRGTIKEFQSHQEEYFSHKTRLLIDLDRYEDCLDCCNLAFEKIVQFHHDNNLWIEERRSRCLANMGSTEEAILKLKQILLEKDNWFLKESIAKLYKQIGNLPLCQFFYCCAAISRSPIEMKVNLLVELGDIFIEDGNISQLHYQMAKKIREEHGWSIPYTLYKRITDESIVPDIKKLNEVWMNFIYSNSQVFEGSIISFNGNTGFIKTDIGSFFFRKNNVYNGMIRKYDNVSFILTDSYDKSKNKQTQEANYILLKSICEQV